MSHLGLYHFIVISTLLFSVGLYGVIASRNAIRVLMSIELMLNAVNLNMVAFNNYLHLQNLSGQVFSIFILTVSAAEAAVGLSILIALYRLRTTVDMERFTELKG